MMEKHMLGALCEDLGSANEQTCTLHFHKLHFPHRYHHLVLQSVPKAHICHNTVATARSGPQIARTHLQPRPVYRREAQYLRS